MKAMEQTAGKVALVTGASRGIGRAVALALARAGADVAVNYRAREADARQVAREIAASGRRSMAVRADVSRAEDVRQMIAAVEGELGPVDILVNNAGIARRQPLEEITELDWNELMAVNLTSCFLTTQAVIAGMRARRWGRIVNISSVAAQTGGVVGPHYAASKAGMLGLTHSYAALCARDGVTVNAVAPALIETEMVTANPAARADLIPVGRFGTVEETADAVLMLVRNGYITGQTINVNGGWHMS
jgi:3-oxoacyl-[acyl-carrier protein] reductase